MKSGNGFFAGGEIAGLTFAARTDDEEQARRLLERMPALEADFPGEFIVDVRPGGESPRRGRILPGDVSRVEFDHRDGVARVQIGADGALVGEIDENCAGAVFYNIEPGMKETFFSDFFRFFVQTVLIRRGGALLHGCGVVRKGRGYLFTGPSETGKSTTAATCAPSEVLSDEIVCVRRAEGGWRLHSTFWRRDAVGDAPLTAVFLMRRGDFPTLAAASPAEAVARLIENPSPPVEAFGGGAEMLELYSALVARTPCFHMRITPGASHWAEIESAARG